FLHREQVFDLFTETSKFNWLGIVVIAAGLNRFLAIRHPSVRGQGDDGDMASRLVSLEQTSYFPTAHNWKTYVHENEVRCFRTRQQKSLLAILRGDDTIALALKPSG